MDDRQSLGGNHVEVFLKSTGTRGRGFNSCQPRQKYVEGPEFNSGLFRFSVLHAPLWGAKKSKTPRSMQTGGFLL